MTEAARSLYEARARCSDEPPHRGSTERFAAKHLSPDEHVYAAIMGMHWTWTDDPYLLVTNRRVLRLQQPFLMFFIPERIHTQLTPSEVVGASYHRHFFLSDRVHLHLRNGRRHRMAIRPFQKGQVFVDIVNRLVGNLG